MNNVCLLFLEEHNGYNKKQIDKYIEILSKEYQYIYDENQRLKEKNTNLSDKQKQTDTQVKPGLSSGVLAKMLVEAEVLVQNTISAARDEAAQIIANARGEEAKIIQQAKLNAEKAQTTMNRAIKNINDLLDNKKDDSPVLLAFDPAQFLIKEA